MLLFFDNASGTIVCGRDGGGDCVDLDGDGTAADITAADIVAAVGVESSIVRSSRAGASMLLRGTVGTTTSLTVSI